MTLFTKPKQQRKNCDGCPCDQCIETCRVPEELNSEDECAWADMQCGRCPWGR